MVAPQQSHTPLHSVVQNYPVWLFKQGKIYFFQFFKNLTQIIEQSQRKAENSTIKNGNQTKSVSDVCNEQLPLNQLL
jgi:hypothetical protein